METPQTAAGVATEEIMGAFSAFGPQRIAALDTPQYNAVYRHVYDTLQRHMAPAPMGIRCFCSLCEHTALIGGDRMPGCKLPSVELDDHGICISFQRRPGV